MGLIQPTGDLNKRGWVRENGPPLRACLQGATSLWTWTWPVIYTISSPGYPVASCKSKEVSASESHEPIPYNYPFVSISISSVSIYLTYWFCSLENLEGSCITIGLVFSMARGYVMSMWVISDLTICQLTWLWTFWSKSSGEHMCALAFGVYWRVGWLGHECVRVPL